MCLLPQDAIWIISNNAGEHKHIFFYINFQSSCVSNAAAIQSKQDKPKLKYSVIHVNFTNLDYADKVICREERYVIKYKIKAFGLMDSDF